MRDPKAALESEDMERGLERGAMGCLLGSLKHRKAAGRTKNEILESTCFQQVLISTFSQPMNDMYDVIACIAGF